MGRRGRQRAREVGERKKPDERLDQFYSDVAASWEAGRFKAPVRLRGWTLSAHAMNRCREMGLWPGEVVDACADPEISYPGGPSHPPGRQVRARGRVAAVVSDDAPFVWTVLWHGKVFTRPAPPAVVQRAQQYLKAMG